MSNKNKTGKIENRALSGVELRAAEGDKFEISGQAIAYGVPSGLIGGVFREIIRPRAFSASIAANDIKAVWAHDLGQILGRLQNGTLTLDDTDAGLRFICKLNPESQAHRDIFASVKRGDIDQMSFSFTVPDGGDEWTETTDERGTRVPLRIVSTGKLFEISCVALPAYPRGTSVSARGNNGYTVAAGAIIPNRVPSPETAEKLERLNNLIADSERRSRLHAAEMQMLQEGK